MLGILAKSLIFNIFLWKFKKRKKKKEKEKREYYFPYLKKMYI